MKEYLNPALNTVLNLPINAKPMRICEEMSEQFHREITGKCGITNFMYTSCHTVVSVHDPCSAVNGGENLKCFSCI